METKILVLIAVVVFVSGCTTNGGSEGNGNEAGLEESYSIGKGLEILSFQPSDPQLYPDQRAVLILRMRNHHINDIDINQMQVYNLGPLELIDSGSGWEDKCTPSEIRPAQHGSSPLVECKWRVRAPEDMGDFESKTISPRLQLRYDSVLSNSKNPVELQFKDYTQIDSPQEIQRTFSNEEVEYVAEVETPSSTEGTKIGLKFRNVGNGKLIPLSENDETKTFYEVGVSPESVFRDCSPSFEVTSPISSQIETSCDVYEPTGEPVVRNLVFSTSYKYQRSPSLDIEVINDQ